jgi:predicted DNA-binding transcriptional regulator AlpA
LRSKKENRKAREEAKAKRAKAREKAKTRQKAKADDTDGTLPLMLDKKQLLKRVPLAYNKILELIKRREFPPARRVGRKNVWMPDEVKKWGMKQEPVVELKPVPGLKGYDWNTLVKLEPRLDKLYRKVTAIKDDPTKPSFCANYEWYDNTTDGPSLESQMCTLVGRKCKNTGGDKRLKSKEAYDIAYRTLYNKLPDCRNCQCPPDTDAIAEEGPE